ncbi:MAG: transglycosylase SLT domain-containing protein [Deltaproteobacteria bacterium]|jgi:hypothetical protein|nr:transglycosylase SLT domain-containing protein [Deltaproteobacteria bacterium]
MFSRRALPFPLTLLILTASHWLAAPPSLARAAEFFSASLNFAGESVPLNQAEVFEGVDQELLLLSEAKARTFLSLRRAAKTLPAVESALKESGVPNDFKYLPLTLTNLNPTYRSGGRRGIWRLSEGEARAMGLTVNKSVDERLDPVLSSQKAAAQLKALRDRYGSWAMALAALLSEGELAAAQAEAPGEKNFYRLYVPENLGKNFYQVIAGKVLYGDPAAYGYRSDQSWPVLAKSRLALSEPQSLKDLAREHRLDYKTFRDLNPHILGDIAPAGVILNIP